MSDFKGLVSICSGYLQEAELVSLTRAYEFVLEKHAGKRHVSGAPYISHLIEVASTLAAMKLDIDTVVSGLLHGVLKEEVSTKKEVAELFGKDVARIVDGTTRITNIAYSSQLAHQAENIRKLFMAMGADIRVLLVKLADRLQDMVALSSADEERQRNVASETMDLYAPLASRLGIDWMKRELEDLSFRFLHPVEHADLSSRLENSLEQRQAYVEEVLEIIKAKLKDNNIRPIRIIGRPKHLYSIYKKLMVQGIPLEKVYDKVAFRIIVNDVKECYESLGTVHGSWQPVPSRIKDFISTPKSNNYQSLHTTVSGPQGHFIEIQIRTEEMDRVALEGVAAHWAYKEGQKITKNDARLFRDFKMLVKVLQEVEDSGEFLESVRSELFYPDVYALTPQGEVRELPRGSTPIDFAYSIHTAVGDGCTGARVNDQLVPLKYELHNGDIVEIITSKKQHPKRAWLQFVKTSRAKTRIRQWLRREDRENFLYLGREICERELKKRDVSFKKLIKSGHLKVLFKQLGSNSLDDMLVKVGSGVITLQHLIRVLQPEELGKEEEKQRANEPLAEDEKQENKPVVEPAVEPGRDSIDIDGMDDMLVRVSQCCKPVPGDKIVGFITTGRGVSIHKAECNNLRSTDPNRWLSVNWSGTPKVMHRAELFIKAENRKKILAEISATISADDADIVGMNARTTVENLAELDVIVEVTDLEHLRTLQQHIQQVAEVIEVRRR